MAGYIGNYPTAVPLTGADLTDGIITSAKIADGTISSADLASGVGGKVLQVVSATDSTQRSTTSATYVTASNTLSVSITPSSASNKIFIIATTTTTNQGNASSNFTIFRDSTNLASASGFQYTEGNSGVGQELPTTMSYLDSPSSTSALTYQVYAKSESGGVFTYLNITGVTGTIIAFEIAG